VSQNKNVLAQYNPLILDGPLNSMVQFAINNLDSGEHPIHLHGHNFAVLGVGTGQYNGAVPNGQTPLDYSNPPKRDVIGVPAFGYAVIRFRINNPGVWSFHCHIDWHASAGLVATIIERPQDLINLPIPQDVLDLCSS